MWGICPCTLQGEDDTPLSPLYHYGLLQVTRNCLSSCPHNLHKFRQESSAPPHPPFLSYRQPGAPCAIQQQPKSSTQASGNAPEHHQGKPELPCCSEGSSPITLPILNFLSSKYQLWPALKCIVIAIFLIGNIIASFLPFSCLPFSTGRNAEHDRNYQSVTLCNYKRQVTLFYPILLSALERKKK